MRSLGGTSSTYWLWTIESTSVKSSRVLEVAAVSLPLLATPPPSDRVRMSRSEEIRTTFFMCRMGRIVYASVELSFWTQPLGRVLGLALVPHLEVEARPLQRAGVSDGADDL